MHPRSDEITLRVASFPDLDTTTLYALLKLRVDVFVVEQDCAYPELDGRDTEPGTRHLWLARDRAPLAYLRILSEPEGSERIGRMAVARKERGGGHAGRLMAEALRIVGHRPAVLAAQSYLVDFYAGFGFVIDGDEFIDDDIPHIPMRRDADAR